MTFKQFIFHKPEDRPFFYTSFVSTIDGKVMVKKKGYWPIGTKEDFGYFTNLRAHADAIVDAKNTALRFGKFTINTINDTAFQGIRKKLGKEGHPEYIVLTSNPDEALRNVLKNNHGFETMILTPESGSKRIDIKKLIEYLNIKKHKCVYIDGGPSLIAQLLKSQVLDEIHLTVTPKIFGSMEGQTLTLVEGYLFPPDNIPKFHLKEVTKIGDEVILRYSLPRFATSNVASY